uniref:Leucine rich immune protein (Short) n=1 Tax=Anopheles maculatus TaxID=74869 RepID=A0A182T199_9DIPT
MAMFRYCTILGIKRSLFYIRFSLLSGIVGLAVGSSQGNSEVVYKCAPTPSPVCFVNFLTFEDPTANLMLKDVANKKTLNIKGGKIVALQSKHCESLSNFERILIGRVGLKELCFTTNFVQVSAEHNHLKTLHVDKLPADSAPYRVEELRLNDNQLESVDAVCNFVALKELHLEQNLLSTLDMNCFAEMKQLKKLHLAYNRLNMVSTTIGELPLPALSFLALQNNTLTELDLRKWSLPALEVLELSSNNLTSVRGLAKLEMLSEVSLAGNRWYCKELDQMLATLESDGVSVKDGDHNCSGIRNGTICCTYEPLASEGTLLDELRKFSELEQRYGEAENGLREMVQREIEAFENKIKELKKTHAKRDEVPAGKKDEGVKTGTDSKGAAGNPSETGNDLKQGGEDQGQANTDKPVPVATCECVCSKDKLDALEQKLTVLGRNINANNATLQALRDNQSQVSYVALLAKHEFRTAVKRGEYKLKELSSMLAMLREHIKQKQKQH